MSINCIKNTCNIKGSMIFASLEVEEEFGESYTRIEFSCGHTLGVTNDYFEELLSKEDMQENTGTSYNVSNACHSN